MTEAGISSALPGERPCEKVRARGAGGLTDVELLALLLRDGGGGRSSLAIARDLFDRCRDWHGLARMTPGEALRIKGIGASRAAVLQGLFEIARRWATAPDRPIPLLRTPEEVARLMIPRLRPLTVEVFLVLALDARNGLRREAEITRGTLTASVVHPREVFKVAIDERAASIIVVHNHPSGNPEPSREDEDLTRMLAEAGKIIGIPLNDHVIVAGERHTSLAARGLI